MMVFHLHELLCFYQNFGGRLSSLDVLVQLHFIPSETQLMGKHNVSCVSVCDCMDTILSINTRARNIHSYVKTMDGIFVLFQRIHYRHVTSRQREKDGKEHDTHTHAHTYWWNNVRHSSGADIVDGVYFCAKDQNKDFSASKQRAMTTTTTPPIPMRMKTEAEAAADQYDEEYKNHNDSETGSIQHKRRDGIVATTEAEISPTKSMNIQLRPCSLLLLLLLLLLLQLPLRLLFIVLFSIASSLFFSCSRRSAEDRIISLEIHSVVRSLCVCVVVSVIVVDEDKTRQDMAKTV